MSCPRFAVSAALAAALAVLACAAAAETPPPGAPPPAQQAEPPKPAPSGEPFGQEVTLEGKTVVVTKGTATWDSAFETLKGALKSVSAFLDKQGLKASGPMLVVYMAPDDTGFQYQAEIPIAEAPKNPPHGEISVGTSPTGKMLKFVHRGSYDSMETTYEAITNFLDEKGLDASDMYVEEYVSDPLKTAEDKLVVNIYIPVK